MQNGSSVAMCTHCVHVSARLAPDVYARSVFVYKTSASELSRKFIERPLLVGPTTLAVTKFGCSYHTANANNNNNKYLVLKCFEYLFFLGTEFVDGKRNWHLSLEDIFSLFPKETLTKKKCKGAQRCPRSRRKFFMQMPKLSTHFFTDQSLSSNSFLCVFTATFCTRLIKATFFWVVVGKD